MKSNTKQFIDRATIIHNNRYNYSLVDYKTSTEEIQIICNEHGVFFQKPKHHLQAKGCSKCVGKNKTTDEFIKKAENIHGRRYSYNKTKYVGCNTKITITCSEHNDFEQTPDSHLRGRGCPVCAQTNRTRYHLENAIGWSHSSWQKAAEKSKQFDSFKVYILECIDTETNEHFFKIGKTYTSIKRRFRSKKIIPYTFSVLKVKEFSDAKSCSLYEEHLKDINKETKYIPFKQFDGKNECFLIITTGL